MGKNKGKNKLGNIKIVDLSKHKIGQLIENDVLEIAKISAQTNLNSKITISPRQMYVWHIFNLITQVINNIKDLEYSLLFITNGQKNKKILSQMSLEDYYIYHNSAYLKSIVGILDRSLLLANYVCDTGLSTKYIKFDNTISNSNINPDLIRVIKNMNKFLNDNNIKENRNLSVHQRKIFIDVLTEAAELDFVSTVPGISNNEKIALAKLAKRKYSEGVKLIKKDMKGQIKIMNGMVVEMLDLIYPIIKNKALDY